MQLHSLAAEHPGNLNPVPTERGAIWAPVLEKTPLPLPGTEPRFLGRPADRRMCQKFCFSVFHETLN